MKQPETDQQVEKLTADRKSEREFMPNWNRWMNEVMEQLRPSEKSKKGRCHEEN